MKTAVPPSTRETLLTEARRLLQSRGYDSFSFQDLADKAGIRKASVHTHFKDKEELGVRLVEQYIADWESWVAYVAPRTPLEQMKSFGRMVKKIYTVGEHLCANGSFFSDWGALPPRMRKEALRLQELQLAWITRTLDAAREAGELRFEGPARPRAQQWMITLIGAMQAARAWQNPELFDSMLSLCLGDLGGKDKK